MGRLTAKRAPEEVHVPTGLRGGGSVIVTRFPIVKSWDVDWPIKALERFAASHPAVAERQRWRELRNQLLELGHVMVQRELAKVVVGSWTGTPVPSWPEDHDPECCTCCEDDRDDDA